MLRPALCRRAGQHADLRRPPAGPRLREAGRRSSADQRHHVRFWLTTEIERGRPADLARLGELRPRRRPQPRHRPDHAPHRPRRRRRARLRHRRPRSRRLDRVGLRRSPASGPPRTAATAAATPISPTARSSGRRAGPASSRLEQADGIAEIVLALAFFAVPARDAIETAMLYVEIGIVVVLICVNGLLAMSELADRLLPPGAAQGDDRPRRQGRRPRAGAGRQSRARFLSTVQIGITLVGVLSGAFSGATLGQRLSDLLWSHRACPTASPTRSASASSSRVITYGSLIIGELVPKQIALRDPEGIAVMVAPAMTILAKVAAPLVWLLDISGRARAAAARPARRERGEGHRRGDQDAGRRGRASRHDRIRRAPHDRRRHAARRPRRARRDDAAHRGRLAQPRMGRGDATARC